MTQIKIILLKGLKKIFFMIIDSDEDEWLYIIDLHHMLGCMHFSKCRNDDVFVAGHIYGISYHRLQIKRNFAAILIL